MELSDVLGLKRSDTQRDASMHGSFQLNVYKLKDLEVRERSKYELKCLGTHVTLDTEFYLYY